MRGLARVSMLAATWLLLQRSCCLFVEAVASPNAAALTSYRDEYASNEKQPDLITDDIQDYCFERCQSPSSIQKSLQSARRRSPLKWFQGKDGRKGYVSSTKLTGDWVLAESQQLAANCTTNEVLQAYLSGDLQQRWNNKEVIQTSFHQKSYEEDDEKDSHLAMEFKRLGSKAQRGPFRTKRDTKRWQQSGIYYQQDLVLRSQRIIRSHTGIMRYSQNILIDKIGHDSYTVLVRLDPQQQPASATSKKPFESLSVYVGLQQRGNDVDIYAAGVMKVNRKIVPNLVVFDASGIAGSMAGKGTLWLAGHFDQRRLSLLERQ
jgi:hypothetical protein